MAAVAISRRIALLAAILTTALGQTNSADSAQNLVRLDLSASNAQGPITDLRAGEIQVREDGEVRRTVFFRFAGVSANPAPATQGERVNSTGLAPMVILMDRWNENIVTAATTQNEVRAALQQVAPGQRLYIYFLTSHGDLFAVNPLPASGADLHDTAQPAAAELRAKLEEAFHNLFGFREGDVRDPVAKANTTVAALRSLVTQMSLIPGRKDLIWVTQGFPVRIRFRDGTALELAPQIRALSAIAVQSQTAIYPVDESRQGAGASPGGFTRDTLRMFASLSGGRWYQSESTAAALAGAMADARGSYRIAYYTPARETDDKEHKIRLESSRKDIRFLAADAYFGQPFAADPDTAERTLLTNLSHSPFDAAEIGLRVKLSPGAGGKSHVAIRIDPADLLLELRDAKYNGELALRYAFYSQDGLKEVSARTPIQIHLAADQLEKSRTGGINLSQDLLLASEIEKIRVLVFDRKLYAAGSVTVAAPK